MRVGSSRELGALLLSVAGFLALGCNGGNAVRDANGKPAAGAEVTMIQLRDARDQVPDQPSRHRTSANRAGEFGLPVLPAGTHLIVALQPLSDGAVPDLDSAFSQIAAGGMPEGCLVGRAVLTSDGRASWSGVTVQLGCGADEGTPVRGRLTGAFQPDAFTYDIEVSVQHPGVSSGSVHAFTYTSAGSPATSQPVVVETQQFHAIPAADGSFDLGRIPAGQRAQLTVKAGAWGGLLFNESTVLDDSASRLEIDLPFHARVPIRVEGTSSGGPSEGAYVDYWDPGQLQGAGSFFVDEQRGSTIVLRQGASLLRARADAMASAMQTVQIEPGHVPGEIVLALEPCPSWSTRILDEHGRPLPFGFLRLGTRDSVAFADPYRAILFPDSLGETAIQSLLPGVYPAELTIDALMRTERRLTFDLDLTQARPEIRVHTEG